MSALERKIIGKRGSFMSFEACESKILIQFVPFPSVGIAEEGCFVMLYFIVFKLFRKEND